MLGIRAVYMVAGVLVGELLAGEETESEAVDEVIAEWESGGVEPIPGFEGMLFACRLSSGQQSR